MTSSRWLLRISSILVRDHPFVDGNKRTGAVTAIVFLAMNGLTFEAAEAALEALVREVAGGRADKADTAEFFRGWSHSP